MKYKVLRELSYPPKKVAKVGAIVDDLPTVSIPWLLKEGLIAPVDTEQETPKKGAK